MLAEWGDAGQDDIRLSLWIDYGFMLVYGAFFTLAGLATRDFARERGKAGAGLGGPRGPPGAPSAPALFDAIENANLLLILGGHGGCVSPPLATACASVKFLLIAIGDRLRAVGAGRPVPGQRLRRLIGTRSRSPVARLRPISQVRLLERWASKSRPASSSAWRRVAAAVSSGWEMPRSPAKPQQVAEGAT